jgi:hypothetical protein
LAKNVKGVFAMLSAESINVRGYRLPDKVFLDGGPAQVMKEVVVPTMSSAYVEWKLPNKDDGQSTTGFTFHDLRISRRNETQSLKVINEVHQATYLKPCIIHLIQLQVP